jgi:hypothetical protein
MAAQSFAENALFSDLAQRVEEEALSSAFLLFSASAIACFSDKSLGKTGGTGLTGQIEDRMTGLSG